MAVDLDRRAVDEQRYIAQARHLVLDHRRRHLGRQAPDDTVQCVDLRGAEPGQILTQPAARRGFIQTQQLLTGCVGSQRIEIRERPVP